ncbi:hypothetical protein BS78_04G133600 [Paspalum vaginatum]|nr:hypothetical protein BS78_04G133600 [Paspalum vaginatum]
MAPPPSLSISGLPFPKAELHQAAMASLPAPPCAPSLLLSMAPLPAPLCAPSLLPHGAPSLLLPMAAPVPWRPLCAPAPSNHGAAPPCPSTAGHLSLPVAPPAASPMAPYLLAPPWSSSMPAPSSTCPSSMAAAAAALLTGPGLPLLLSLNLASSSTKQQSLDSSYVFAPLLHVQQQETAA